MAAGEWTKEIFPGIYIIGNDASDTGGNQAILIERREDKQIFAPGGHIYLILTDGFDYGSWVGEYYELTPQEKEQVMNWKDGSYDLKGWLRKKKGGK